MPYNQNMPLKYLHSLIPQAKKLRREMTPQEKRLWYEFLADFSPRFQRQKTIDRFIADFYCYKAKLIVEIDGSQHYTEAGLAYDAERDAILSGYGLRVIRFSNSDVNANFEGVCSTIMQSVITPLPTPNHPTAAQPPKPDPD
jgi:very-short-patch-repair endonuclease